MGRPESIRERILWATLQIVGTDGVDGVRHRRVAEVAEVSLGSTTYHFAMREELIREAFRWYLAHATEVIGEIADRHRREDPVGRIVGLLTDLIGPESEDEGLVRAEYELLLYAGRDPELIADVQAWEAAQRRVLARDLAAAGCASPSASAIVLIALTRGLELERLTHRTLSTRQLRARIAPVVQALCQQ
jgi:TetR/AcrR family transcriptional regulator, regulator of biofilm formation and stress response